MSPRCSVAAGLETELLDAKVRKYVTEPGAYRRGPLQRGLARWQKDAIGIKQAGCGLGIAGIHCRDVLIASPMERRSSKMWKMAHSWSYRSPFQQTPSCASAVGVRDVL